MFHSTVDKSDKSFRLNGKSHELKVTIKCCRHYIDACLTYNNTETPQKFISPRFCFDIFLPPVVFQQKDEREKDETDEIYPEEDNNLLTGNSVKQAEDERRSEEEEEAVELDMEPEVEEEGQEKLEEQEVEETEVVLEEERKEAEEMMEEAPGAEDEEAKMAKPQPEEDESVDVVVGDDAVHVSQLENDDIHAELGVRILAEMCGREAASSQSSGSKDGKEGLVEGQKIDQQEDGAANPPDGDQTEGNVERQDREVSLLDTKQAEDQTHVPSKLLPLSNETQSQKGPVSPSKTRTTTLHISLLSPSSEKGASFFQQSPTAADPVEGETPLHALAPAEQNTASTEQEAADTVEPVEEEMQSVLEDQTELPVSVEEAVNQLSSHSDQSKVPFTVASLQQGSPSTPEDKEGSAAPSSSPACISSSSSSAAEPGDVEVVTKKDPEVNVKPVSLGKAELVLSPGQVRNAGSATIKPQSNTTLLPPPTKPQTSAAATTEGKAAEHAQSCSI